MSTDVPFSSGPLALGMLMKVEAALALIMCGLGKRFFSGVSWIAPQLS